MAKLQPMQVRKLADKTSEERQVYVAFAPGGYELQEDGTVVAPLASAERRLVNPATEGYEHESWPFAGLAIEGEAPKRTRVATSWVTQGQVEGWLELEGERVVHRPGGPAAEPWRVTHTFVHADALVLDTVDGKVRYKVVHQPDKYADAAEDEATGTPGGRVDWFYELELES